MGLPWGAEPRGGGTERSWWGAPASNLRPAARTPPSFRGVWGTAWNGGGRREAWRLRGQNKWEVTEASLFPPSATAVQP